MDNPMPPSLVESMGTLEDFRIDRTKLPPLTDILVLSVLAVRYLGLSGGAVLRLMRPTMLSD